jgi:hypothetical protein
MAPRFLTILTGRPVAAGVKPKKNPCPEAKPAEVFRRSAPVSKRYGANISAGSLMIWRP